MRAFVPTLPMLILMGLLRGYVMPMQEGFDNDDPLAADKGLDEERKKLLLSSLRWMYGIHDQANDNGDWKEPAA